MKTHLSVKSFLITALGMAIATNALAITGVDRIVPSSPLANEPIEVQVEVPKGLMPGSVKFTNGTFVVNLVPDPNAPAILSPRTMSIRLGQLPEGDYQVLVSSPLLEPIRDALSFTVKARETNPDTNSPRLGAFDVSGLWWDPSRSGEGITFSRVGNNELFGTLFVSTRDVTSPWYTVQGCQLINNRCVSPMYSVRRNADFSLSVTQAGTAELVFKSEKNAELNYQVGNETPVSMKLVRMDY